MLGATAWTAGFLTQTILGGPIQDRNTLVSVVSISMTAYVPLVLSIGLAALHPVALVSVMIIVGPICAVILLASESVRNFYSSSFHDLLVSFSAAAACLAFLACSVFGLYTIYLFSQRFVKHVPLGEERSFIVSTLAIGLGVILTIYCILFPTLFFSNYL